VLLTTLVYRHSNIVTKSNK